MNWKKNPLEAAMPHPSDENRMKKSAIHQEPEQPKHPFAEQWRTEQKKKKDANQHSQWIRHAFTWESMMKLTLFECGGCRGTEKRCGSKYIALHGTGHGTKERQE
jgi:hypothetical protein